MDHRLVAVATFLTTSVHPGDGLLLPEEMALEECLLKEEEDQHDKIVEMLEVRHQEKVVLTIGEDLVSRTTSVGVGVPCLIRQTADGTILVGDLGRKKLGDVSIAEKMKDMDHEMRAVQEETVEMLDTMVQMLVVIATT